MAKQKTHGEFIREINNKFEGEFSVIGEYVNSIAHIKIKHNKCGLEFHIQANSALRSLKQGTCPKCSKNKQRTHEQFTEEIYNIHKNNITLLENYKNGKTKIKVRNNQCEHEYIINPMTLLKGTSGCELCYYLSKRKTTEQYNKELEIKYNGEFSLVGEYTTGKHKVVIKHEICGYEQDTTPHQFSRLISKCPNCVPPSSTGERLITDYLNSLSLSFIPEKRFANCRNKRSLPFDFYIEEKILIEFDGEQHFKPVNFGERDKEKGLNRMEITIKHDSIKNEYCIANNIPLFRIPYWEKENTEKILESILINYNIIEKTKEQSNIKYLDYIVDENYKQKKLDTI